MSANRGTARLVLPIAVVAIAAFVAFLPALSNGFQNIWDDNENITQNGFFRGLDAEHFRWFFTSNRLGHWQPLSWFSLAVDHAIWGLDPFGYHLTNLVLHACNAALFFLLSRAALRAAGSPFADDVFPSLFAALLFAVHPLRVESVAWVTERRDVLSTAFLLLTLLAWFKRHETGERRFFFLALLAFALSLMSKAWGITLPAVLFVLDAYPFRRVRRGSIVKLVVEKVPFGLLALPAAYLAYRAQSSSGAMHYADTITPLQQVAQASYGLCFYLVRTVWPGELSPAVVLDRRLDPFSLRFLVPIVVVALSAVAYVVLLARRRAPALLASLAIYAITVAPVLGFTQSGLQLVADRYSYLATMPFAILAGAGLARLAKKTGAVQAVQAAALAVIAVFGWRAYDYTKAWDTSETLFRHAVAVDPENWFAWTQLGTSAQKDGRLEESLELYDRAIAGDPDNAHLAHEGRTTVRLALGDSDGAREDCDRAIAQNPSCAFPFVNRGGIASKQGDWAGAAADFERALELKEDLAIAWLNLGVARYQLGDRAGAREAFFRCTQHASPESPMLAEAQKKLAAVGGPP